MSAPAPGATAQVRPGTDLRTPQAPARPAPAPRPKGSEAFGLRAHLALMGERARAGHLPVLRQALEMVLLRVLRGLGPNYYQIGGFWRRELTWRQKLAHPSARRYRRALDRLNPEVYRKVFQHKLYEKAALGLLGVPTAPFVGYAHRVAGYAGAQEPLRSLEDFRALLGRRMGTRICFKELQGWGGRGFKAVEVVRSREGPALRPLLEAETIEAQTYWERVLGMAQGGEWLIEEYVEQHPEFARFNASSLNTVRVVAAKTPTGEARILGAYLRIGQPGSLVDNVYAGGTTVTVDIHSGTLVAVRQYRPDFVPRDTDPVTGEQLVGRVLPDWASMRALVERAMTRIPSLGFAEFDTAMSRSGALVVEVNPITDQSWMFDLLPWPEHFPLERL